MSSPAGLPFYPGSEENMLFVLTCGDGRGHVSPLATPSLLPSTFGSPGRQAARNTCDAFMNCQAMASGVHKQNGRADRGSQLQP